MRGIHSLAVSSAVVLAAAALVGGQSAPGGIAVQHFDSVKADQQAWGTLRWMMNGQLDARARQTFGVAELKTGRAESAALSSEL